MPPGRGRTAFPCGCRRLPVAALDLRHPQSGPDPPLVTTAGRAAYAAETALAALVLSRLERARFAGSTDRVCAPGGASYYLGALTVAVRAGTCHTGSCGPPVGVAALGMSRRSRRGEWAVSESKAGWLRSRQSNVVGGRVHRHVVKLTDEQELAVQAAARVQGVTVARLLADSALTAPRASVSREDLTELFETTRLIGALGNNLNQIAKVANSTGELVPETAATLAAVRRVFDRVLTLPRELTGT